jgi:hydrogenase nickel incorporation protein HypB
MTELTLDAPLLFETARAGEANRVRFAERGLFVLNLMSGPGAGKTRLLERTLEGLAGELRIGVIEGDIEGAADAARLARLGAPVTTINTHGSCHLDPRPVMDAALSLPLAELDLLVIENVGNLVCPAEFDVGESARAMLLSVPEGHDKPAKYPLMFRTADLLLINKIDLADLCDFDADAAEHDARALNPALDVVRLSCRTGEGLEGWFDWLKGRVGGGATGRPAR